MALQSFGLYRKQKRLMEAASEMHLLQDGEEILGALCWKNVEEIDDISLEYWQLRKLNRRCNEIIEKIAAAEKILDKSHSERAELTDRDRGEQAELLDDLALLERSKEKLTRERNEIIMEAKAVRRRYETMKTKLTVLEEEDAVESEGYREGNTKLAELKKQFGDLKKRRSEIGGLLDETEGDFQKHKDLVFKREEGVKGTTVETYSLLGRANRDLSQFRSKLGVEKEEVVRLQRVIGRFLCVHESDSTECRKAVTEHRQLVTKLNLLRDSVNMNHTLAHRI